jgi:HD-GYP domain-containing protein (c-di-GMP phosphodiesterase class II)
MVVSKKLIGKILAMPIYMSSGIVLLGTGSILTELAIDKILKRGITTVYIEDNSCVIDMQEMIETKEKLKILFDMKVLFDNVEKNKRLDSNLAEKIVTNVVQNINLSENAFLYSNVSMGENTGLELTIHSFEVLVYSILVGLRRKYDSKKILNLGLGALLHDIGKIFEEDKKHTNLGYNFVKSQMNIPTTSYICILQHHEYEDGSGYPDGLKGDNIYELSKIVGICNEYINLIHSKETHLPSEAIEIMTARAITKFDQDIFKSFMNSVYCYPNGLEVRLTTNQVGIVVKQNKELPTRPIIGAFEDGKPILVDLTKQLTNNIEEIIW